MTPLPKGYGFLYERHPVAGVGLLTRHIGCQMLFSVDGPEYSSNPWFQRRWLVGHPGFGGSTVMMDIEEEVRLLHLYMYI